jgi:hypothetical protein
MAYRGAQVAYLRWHNAQHFFLENGCQATRLRGDVDVMDMQWYSQTLFPDTLMPIPAAFAGAWLSELLRTGL